MNRALEFLKSQKLMAIASADDRGPWIANVYYGAADDGRLYFVSPEKNRHSATILKNPRVAVSVAWFDPKNNKNRKAIQGLGACYPTNNPPEIATGAKLLYDKFPDLRDIFTVEWIMKNVWGSKIWIIKPTYLKYWDDELYGENESEEVLFTESSNVNS